MSASLRLSLALLASTLLASASEFKIVRVVPEYKGEASFERIAEYFGGKESYPGMVVQRSQSDNRSGFYFLVRLSDPERVPAGSTWKLQVILPGSDKPKDYRFPCESASRKPVHQLGLTGGDWPDPKTNPTAWRVALLGPDGAELLSSQSFLWQ